jgi:hypothetical protein
VSFMISHQWHDLQVSCSSHILCIAVHDQLLAFTDEEKQLIILDMESKNVILSVHTPKRANALEFIQNGKQLLLADKFGDVLRYIYHSFME